MPCRGEVPNAPILAETVGYDGGVPLVLPHLNFLLVHPDVEKVVRLLKLDDIEVVHQHTQLDGSRQFFWSHAAKLTLYS